MLGYYLVERREYWDIPLAGKPVCRFKVDMHLILEFFEPEDEETRVEIAGEFRLLVNNGEYKLSAQERTGLGPVLHLYRKTVEWARAFKDGRLEMKFFDDGQLTVFPTTEFESWQVIGARGLRVVCTPSGQLFTWQAEPPDSSEGGVH